MNNRKIKWAILLVEMAILMFLLWRVCYKNIQKVLFFTLFALLVLIIVLCLYKLIAKMPELDKVSKIDKILDTVAFVFMIVGIVVLLIPVGLYLLFFLARE